VHFIILLVIRLLSPLITSSYLPSIVSTNGSETQSQGIGTNQIISSLLITFVLYVPENPFNLIFISLLTRFHDCVVTVTNDKVTLQDRLSRQKKLVSDVSLMAFIISQNNQQHALPHIPHLLYILSWVTQVFPNIKGWSLVLVCIVSHVK
jgi:hypothetical protein